MTDTLTIGVGHNEPPEDANPIADRLAETHRDLIWRFNELVDAQERVPNCISDEAEKKIGDYVKEISQCVKRIESAREDEKALYLDGGRRVDGFFKDFSEALKTIKGTCVNSLTAYKREKEAEARRVLEEKAKADRAAAAEAEEAARLAADSMASETDLGVAVDRETAAQTAVTEAAIAQEAADVSAADLSRTRSENGGSLSSLQSTWKVADVDRATLDLEALRPYLTQADLEKACRAFVRAGGRKLAGSRIYEDKKAVAR